MATSGNHDDTSSGGARGGDRDPPFNVEEEVEVVEAEEEEDEDEEDEEGEDEDEDDGDVRGGAAGGEADDRRSSQIVGVRWNKRVRK